ncbi:MAG: DNA-methyltransferase [Candidatus Nanoarchaeia archaeon]
MLNSDRVIQGDSTLELEKIPSNSVDLVYLDPPFFTQRKHRLSSRDNKRKYEFDDTWESLEDYVQMLRTCLIHIKRILKDTGSVFFHCDKTASHHIRAVLDEVFGMGNFRSEIIWSYKRWSNSKKGLLNSHQNIYFYSKSSKFNFNTIYTEYSPTTNVDQILQKRVRSKQNKSIYARDNEGNILLQDAKKGVPLSDVWEIPYLNPKAKERTGYPTQKPLLLLERIISIASNQGDIVLDPFCGSGSTLVAAKLMGRKYLGIDKSATAIQLTTERLQKPIKSESKLLQAGKDSYRTKDDFTLNLLNSINAVPVYRNSGIDGFINHEDSKSLIPVRIQKKNEALPSTVKSIISATKNKEFGTLLVIRTNNLDSKEEMPLNITVVDSPQLTITNRIDGKLQNVEAREIIEDKKSISSDLSSYI